MGAVVGAQDNAVSDRLNGSFLKWPRAGRSRPAQGGRRIGRSREQRRYDRLLMIASQNGHEDSRPGSELTFSLRSTKQSGFASRALPRILVANHVSTSRCV